jgi:hypothetical protein
MLKTNFNNTNNLLILNPKNMVLNPKFVQDKMEIKHREKNTYYNKIITGNNDEEKIINK